MMAKELKPAVIDEAQPVDVAAPAVAAPAVAAQPQPARPARKVAKKVKEVVASPIPVPTTPPQAQEPAPPVLASVVDEVVAAVEAQPVAVQPVIPAAKPDGLLEELKATFKDVTGTVQKLPVTKQVMGAANRVAEELEKNPMASKVLDQVKTATEQIEHSKIAADVRTAAKSAREGFEKSPLTATVHRVLLASIGAIAIAQEEIEDLINRLVERGEIAEADGKRMMKDVLEKRKVAMEKASAVASEMAEAPKRMADDVEKRVEGVLSRMNIPSKEEIEALSAKITALTRKVDELKKPQ